ncbi:MAG: endonuclease III [Spirochaetales bacterium]|nr:endonuclease III [Spirochaetales bacterium]
MNTTNLNDNYFDSVFSAISSSLSEMGAPIPAVSKIAMEDNSPYRILASTIISLRTRDIATWEASINLFKIAPTIDKLYSVNESIVSNAIKKCGFYLRKASQLKKIAEIVMEEWNGEIPPDEEKLMSLPGVGIKTASLVLNLSFSMDAICVDCHVHQISNRLGWVKTDKPEDTEKELKKFLPRKYWIIINELFVMWGQNVCTPISPKCSICPLSSFCPKIGEERTR